MTRLALAPFVAVCAGALSACVGMPQPATIQPDALSYNEAIAVSARQQLLLNIVRLRYRDTVQFVQITGVTTSYAATRTGRASTLLGLDVGGFDETLGLSGEEERAVRPLVEYEPLQGPAYARQLLSSIAPESLFLLTQSGWSAERLMLCCIARIGPFENARAAAGPTPAAAPDNAAFRTLAADLRALQLEGGLIVEIFDTDAGPRAVLTVRGESEPAQRIRAALALPEGPAPLALSERMAGSGEITVRGRSILGILAALSQTVDVPPEHNGVLTTPTSPDAWDAVIGGYFQVHTSPTPPEAAAVAVQYRGHWFYIDDADLVSKSTFDLVNHLFALQAARGQANAPDPFIVLTPGG